MTNFFALRRSGFGAEYVEYQLYLHQNRRDSKKIMIYIHIGIIFDSLILLLQKTYRSFFLDLRSFVRGVIRMPLATL